ncbi:hypothetical protein J7E88_01550 [Streptomyces sp. ISL-10]|nr:hypothetical protein [Streptomyces sp. ISL-10]
MLATGSVTQSLAEPTPSQDAASGWSSPEPKKVTPKPSVIPEKERNALLGGNYKTSPDVVVTTTGDGTGFHIITAAERDGYQMKTAATLLEGGFASDTWIGNTCTTQSGKYAAVAYAPRMFTNKPELMVRGAFAAIVNLESGDITKLPFQTSLAYFSPGCGTGDQVVFTQLSHDGDEKQQTRLITVNAATGKQTGKDTYPGQVTSAIPTKDGIVAAHGAKVVRINGKKEKVLAHAITVPFQITTDADGGVTFIDRQMDKDAGKTPTSWAKHLGAEKVKAGAKSKPVAVASGRLHAWDLTSTARGEVFITGSAASRGTLPPRVRNPGHLAKDASMSTHGHTALSTTWADGKTTLINPKDASKPRSARTTLRVLATGRETALDLTPGAHLTGSAETAAQGTAKSPALPDAGPVESGPTKGDEDGVSTQTMRTQLIAGTVDNPSEGTGERYCATPRNDVKKQAFQPTPRQVEWAVDQAVVGELNFYRSPNWKNTGTGGYQPQGLFPPTVLAGDPNGTLDNEDPDVTDRWHIPSQVMLGITAQESNMWQATRFAVPGVTANSLIGNYYGVDYAASGEQLDPWRINWADADCGYGITQATDGMRLAGKTKPGETALSPLAQDAVALDYTANIAAGVRILSEKWNQTYNAGMTVNGGHPKWIESWFFALWAYNSGFYATADSAGHSGVGWTNNPANPLWKANRVPFLESASDPSKDDYSHAARPQEWPYQEKVIGWAARPISAMFAPGDFRPGYLASWWNSVYDRSNAKPPVDLFCSEVNFCDPSKIADNDSNDPGLGACMIDSDESNPHWLHCWWDQPVEWKNCDIDASCGYQVHRFNTSYPEQPDANSYPPNCTATGLPSNALIVDDLPNGSVPAGSDSRGCGAVTSKGTFNFSFVPWDTQMDLTNDGMDNPTTVTTYPGKIDTHQIGAGYGNHFWFTHARSPESYPGNASRMKVAGTWTLGQKITTHNGQARVFAHIPDHGAQTGAATYKITTVDGVRESTISQKANQSNKWVDLGAYFFGEVTPQVTLDNFNGESGTPDVAFDAIAFAPGEWNGMKMGTFPNPDPNAPEPAAVEPPATVEGNFFPLSAASSSATMQTAAATTATSLSSCSVTEISVTYDRDNVCVHDKITFGHFKNNVMDGTATFDYRNTITTDPKSGTFTQISHVKLDSMTGVTTSFDFDIDYACRGYCSVVSSTWAGSDKWIKGDTHTATIDTTMKWTPSGTGISDGITPHWTFGGTINGARITTPAKVEKSELTIRCDNIVVNAGAGCVFSWYKPTYVMNSKMYPGAASHIRLMWDKTKITWGNRNGGKPLKYLGKKTVIGGTKLQSTRNREIICKNSWTTYPGTGLYTDLWGTTDQKSCDEFSFAASYQSGGTPTANGGTNPVTKNGSECVQTYIKRNADNTSSIHLRPDYPQPTWREPCGRSSMSNWQNTQSMRPFGDFIKNQRLLQDDEYWVDLDGFTLP